MPTFKNFGPVNFRFLLLSALLVLASCGGDSTELERLKFNSVVLAFGDSLTFGTGATQETNYPAYLEKLIEREVVAAGIPGETTAEGLERLPYALEQVEPDLVLLCLGGNDMLRKLSRSAMEANLSRMIELITDSGAQVVLIGVPTPALMGLEADPVYKQLATRYELPIEYKSVSKALSRSDTRSDRAHPNSNGYKLIAEHIAELLRDKGAL